MKAFKTVAQLVEELTSAEYNVQRESKLDLKAKADTHKDYIESKLSASDFYMKELEYQDPVQAFEAFKDNSKAYMLLISLRSIN